MQACRPEDAAGAEQRLATEVDLSGFGYQVISKIGQGHSACARLVRETQTGDIFVAKCVSLATLSEHDQEFASQEVLLLQTLRHPLIVGYHDSFIIDGVDLLVIVMEHCSGGDLRKVISEKAQSGGRFSEDQVMTWFVQLLLALRYVHSQKVLHRDLKTSNIFVNQGSTSIKLGDFGVSRILECTSDAAVTMVGTPYYMSPEVCRNAPYSWKSDIWSLGCVVYEMCLLRHAFESCSLLGLVYKIVSDHYEPIPAFYSEELNAIICKMLTKSADARPSLEDLIANPYIKSYVDRQEALSQVQPSLPGCALTPKGRRGRAADGPQRPVAAPPPREERLPRFSKLDERARELVLASRMRRRLAGQRLNWVSAFASLDDDGDGALSQAAMHTALATLGLGLSEEEANAFVEALPLRSGSKVPLSSFEEKLVAALISPEVQQLEAWARHLLEPFSSRVALFLRDRDVQRTGVLSVASFRAALAELLMNPPPEQLEALVLLAGKSRRGEVDYMGFADCFGAPPPPPLLPGVAQPGPPSPCGMPPAPPDGDTPRSFFTCTATVN